MIGSTDIVTDDLWREMPEKYRACTLDLSRQRVRVDNHQLKMLGREPIDNRRNMLTVWAAGILMALPLSIPLMNLVVPILGVATFTHIFHQLRA